MHATTTHVTRVLDGGYDVSHSCDSAACEWLGYIGHVTTSHLQYAIADSIQEGRKHSNETCVHANTTTYPTHWQSGDETECDDCGRIFNNAMQEWPDIDGFFRDSFV